MLHESVKALSFALIRGAFCFYVVSEVLASEMMPYQIIKIAPSERFLFAVARPPGALNLFLECLFFRANG
jgi:hypothetical protein